MKRIMKCRAEIMKQGFRVECNCGSKYFATEEKACAYFEYMSACGYAVQLWKVRYCYDGDETLVKGEQRLLRVG